MPTITITFTDSDDPQSRPHTYTLPEDVADKLVFLAAANRRPPAFHAGVMLEDAMALFKPPKPTDKIASTDQPATTPVRPRGTGKHTAAAKDANGTPPSTTTGTGSLTGPGLS